MQLPTDEESKRNRKNENEVIENYEEPMNGGPEEP